MACFTVFLVCSGVFEVNRQPKHLSQFLCQRFVFIVFCCCQCLLFSGAICFCLVILFVCLFIVVAADFVALLVGDTVVDVLLRFVVVILIVLLFVLLVLCLLLHRRFEIIVPFC